ncbi:4Fe-4S dicluster domain-containing protein [Thermosulfuriphilus sp.]
MLVRGHLRDLLALPGSRQILKCIQCGTCSGSCSMLEAMDYGPRRLFALLKGGDFSLALKSNTFWVCSSCYLCTVRCPQGIRITEIMYALKRLALKVGIRPPDKTFHLYEAFIDEVREHGRISEARLMRRYLQRSPGEIFSKIAIALKLKEKGRLDFSLNEIQSLKTFQKVLKRASELETKR